MDIPEIFYNRYSKLEDTFINITSIIKALKECRVEKLYPNQIGKSLTPRTTFRFEVYLQVVLNRVIELSESIILCLEQSNVASAFILLRALDENTSVIFDASIRLNKLIEVDNFQEIYQLIFNLQYGTRLKEYVEKFVNEQSNAESQPEEKEKMKAVYTSQQILDVMDRLSKILKNHRRIYEYLCEYAHPNYDGLMGLYCDWEDQYTVNISKESSLNDRNAVKIFSAFNAFLKMFVEGYDRIVKLFPEITRIAIQDMKSNGEDVSSYENPF